MSNWAAEQLNDPALVGFNAENFMKLAVRSFREASDLFAKLIHKKGLEDQKYLWKDLWTLSMALRLQETELSSEKRITILQGAIDKIFHFTDAVSAEEFERARRDDPEFIRYLQYCFWLPAVTGSKQAFWKWLTDIDPSEKNTILQIIRSYITFSIAVADYLDLTTESSPGWREASEQEKQAMERFAESVAQGETFEYNPARMRNPLLGNPSDGPFSYEELVEKADLRACILALEYIADNKLPKELKQKLRLLIRKLKELDQTIEKYPEHRNEIDRFLSYYIPETIRVTMSYQQYLQASIDQETLDGVYEKVVQAVDTMEDAAAGKIAEIYQAAAMQTSAEADALQDIMRQDGYVGDDKKIKQ